MKKLQKEQKIFLLAMTGLLILQIFLLIFYGDKKSGFHEDELYTYYSTNKTAGLFVEDGMWLEGEALKKEFGVLEGEEFRYSVVKMMQSWDVHPPLYYYLIHTMSSLSTGVFSKWQGLIVNLIAYVLSFLLLAKVVFTVSAKSPYKLTFLVCMFWGFSCAVISGAMFIRMYQWLTVFVLLCLWLHLRAMKKERFGLTFLLPLALTVFLGFMTQYYYIIFHFFLGAGFCLLLLKHRKIKEMFAYAGACAVGLISAILYYPASLSHIFRGYRGTEAVSAFGEMSNTFDRLGFFIGLFNDYVMNGTLYIWLLIICLLGITVRYLHKNKKDEEKLITEPVGLILFTAAGYFFTISKTALLLGETSTRYQLPVYGLLCFLLIYGLWTLLERLCEGKGEGDKKLRIMFGVFLMVLLVTDILPLMGGKVFFLYEEDKSALEYVKEHKEMPAVVFYNEASKDHVWWLSDKLMEHEKTYLVCRQNEASIGEEVFTESDGLLIYMCDEESEAAVLTKIIENNPKLSGYRMIGEKKVWRLYEVF